MNPLPPGSVSGEGEDKTVDASLLAPKLGLDEATLKREMRAGRVTSQLERGEGGDAGRYRLTFRYGERRWRVLVDADGRAYELS